MVPSDAGLRTEPGTAMTGTPRCCASETVSNDPPRTLDSTTTTTSASAARMRLRAGKRWAAGRVPGGPSLQSSPRSAIASQSPWLHRGYTTSSPLPTTATGGGPPSTESAPRCAAPSMPLASPDTTVTPAAARSRPSAAATSMPPTVAWRVPTMATLGEAMALHDPRPNSTGGGSGSSASSSG